MKKSPICNIVLLIVLTVGLLTACKTEKHDENQTIYLKGSDTELDLVTDLCAEFAATSDFKFEIEGGGSEEGMSTLVTGGIDIANSSRMITDEESQTALSNSITPIPIVIAIDAIAIITNPKLGVDSLSTLQLQQILSGAIKNWKQVGGPDLTIQVYGRNSHSGTQQFMKTRFLKNQNFDSKTIELATNKEIVEAVAKNLGAISYVGSGFISNQDGAPETSIWAMYLYSEGDVAYSPYQNTSVINGQYPLVRPLFQYLKKKPTGKIKELLTFELSKKGQDIVRKFGYFPITSFYVSENKKNGL